MKFTKIILCFVILLAIQTNGYSKTDQSVEPADKYILKINEQEFPIELNKYLNLPDSKIILTVDQNKKFNYGGIHFEYPRYYAFEADLKEYYKCWTLSGNDTKIIIQKYKIVIDHKSMAKTLMDAWGKANCRHLNCEMKVPNKTLHGTKVIITMKTTKITQEIYSFKNSTGSMMLIIQDNISDSGSNSAEYATLTKIFDKRFRVEE